MINSLMYNGLTSELDKQPLIVIALCNYNRGGRTPCN
jgi:hypothetical protein